MSGTELNMLVILAFHSSCKGESAKSKVSLPESDTDTELHAAVAGALCHVSPDAALALCSGNDNIVLGN